MGSFVMGHRSVPAGCVRPLAALRSPPGEEADAMEVKPGMFVSPGSTAEWVADPEVPGSSMHELVHDGPVWAGMTRIDDAPDPMPWTPEQREVFVVLEGALRIEFDDGSDVTLEVGDLATIPAGMHTTWHVTTPYKEMWVLAEG
jgi:uncharacterized cupin superfamily protein